MSNLFPPLEFSDDIKKTHSCSLTRNTHALMWSAKLVTQSKIASWLTRTSKSHLVVEDEIQTRQAEEKI